MTAIFNYNPGSWNFNTNGLTQFPANDDNSVVVNLGFTMTVGNFTGNTVTLNNNGLIEFDGGTNFLAKIGGGYQTNYKPINLSTFVKPIIAGLWYDIVTYTPGATCHYGQITIGSQKAFRVIWNNVGAYDQPEGHFSTFAITIYDANPYYWIEVFIDKPDIYQWTNFENPPQNDTPLIGLSLGNGEVDQQWIGINNIKRGRYTFFNGITPLMMAQKLIGSQGEVSSANFYASSGNYGGWYVEPRNQLGISDGIMMGSGPNTSIANIENSTLKFYPVNQALSPNPYTTGIVNAVRQLSPGSNVNDIATLTFLIKPNAATVSLNTVWSSFEYPEYIYGFNDAMSLTFDGNEIAKVGSPPYPISVFQINPNKNAEYYKENYNFSNYEDIKIDAFTTPIVVQATSLNTNNTIRVILSIANAVDNSYYSYMWWGPLTLGGAGGQKYGWDLIL